MKQQKNMLMQSLIFSIGYFFKSINYINHPLVDNRPLFLYNKLNQLGLVAMLY